MRITHSIQLIMVQVRYITEKMDNICKFIISQGLSKIDNHLLELLDMLQQQLIKEMKQEERTIQNLQFTSCYIFILGKNEDFHCFSKLPWQNIKQIPSDQKIQQVGDIKQKQTAQLFKNLPEELKKIYEYLRKLTYASEPDYKSIVKLFQQAAKNSKIKIDQIYDWDIQNTAQTEIYSRYGTIQFDDNFQIDKYPSNQLINIKQHHINPNKRKTFCPSLMKQNFDQNLIQIEKDQSGQSSNSSPFKIKDNNIYPLSRDEISEDSEYIIPEEYLQNNQGLRVRTLPDYLKKPKIKQKQTQTVVFDEDLLLDSDTHLVDNYKKLQSLSKQITSIFHNKQK
ncbi:unnamed protein product [Paramecium sonneborni]|uniref:Kinase domain protein n=1 Tax=Paramecium sonneborni TaxID=65129 RepID=A0A8S1JXL7_9CILI|nr:unnamed protein product [Paramecium sonneborni]